MPLPPVWEPDAEPLDQTVKLRFSVRQLEQLDLAVREFGMSRSWILREAVAAGLPVFVEKRCVSVGVRAWSPAASTSNRVRLVRGGGLARTVPVRIAG